MKLKMPRAAVAGALTSVAFTVAACGTLTADQSDLESSLMGVGEDAGVEVDSVSCPDDVEGKVGVKFECTATLADGQEVDVPGEVHEVTDDEIIPEWTLPPVETGAQ